MKQTLFMLGAALLMLATPSCKKGENDPLTMASRKGRMAGEYTISAYSSNSTYTASNGDVTTTTETLDGNTITETQVYTPSGGGTSVTTTTTITLDLAEVTMDKDGNYTWTWNTTSVSVSSFTVLGFTTTTTSTTVATMIETGMWNFLGKIDEFKNKQRAVFNTTNRVTSSQTTSVDVLVDDSDGSTVSTTTNEGALWADDINYTNGESQMVYNIDQLKKKEIIMMFDWGGSNSYSSTSGSTTTSSTDSDSGTRTMTLTQK